MRRIRIRDLATSLVVAAALLATPPGLASGRAKRIAHLSPAAIMFRSAHDQFAVFGHTASNQLALQLVDRTGRPVGSASLIQPGEPPANALPEGTIAYNNRQDTYLTIVDYGAGGPLIAQRLTGEGRSSGRAVDVTPLGHATSLLLVYNPHRDRYLLVWNQGRTRSAYCPIRAEELDQAGHPMRPSAQISSSRLQCLGHGPVLAAYDDRTHSYLITWLVRHGTAGRTLSAAGLPRGPIRVVGGGQLFTLTFDARRGRYVGAFYRHEASGAAKLQIEQLAPDGALRAGGENLPAPTNAAVGATSIVYARNLDETLLDWTVEYGGYSPDTPAVDHVYADVLAGAGTQRLRRVNLATVNGASDSTAAYDSRDRRFLAVWQKSEHGSPVTYGDLISAASG